MGLPPAQVFQSIDDAADKGGIWDGAVIATPPHLHVAPTQQALEHTRGVLVEKPFTTSLPDAVNLVEEAATAGIPLLVAQNYRYMRATRTIRKIVQEGTLGRIGLVTAHYYRAPQFLEPTLRSIPNSALWGIAVHHLDVLMVILGTDITRVNVTSGTLRDDLPPGATLQLLAEFANGAALNYSASYESKGHEYFERGQEFFQRFSGEEATLHCLYRWLVLCKKGRLPRPVRRGRRERTEEAILLDQLAAAVEDGEEPECSGRDNLRTMAVMEACLRSGAEQRWVGVDEVVAK